MLKWVRAAEKIGDHKARLCALRTWPDFTGYGFNLHAERGEPAQYIGKVDAESPAEASGLREGDRIVAVNGVDVADETHQDVVRRILADSSRVELLVVDAAADVYFRELGVKLSASMTDSAVQRIVCPSTNIFTELSSTSNGPHTLKLYFLFTVRFSLLMLFLNNFIHRKTVEENINK